MRVLTNINYTFNW